MTIYSIEWSIHSIIVSINSIVRPLHDITISIDNISIAPSIAANLMIPITPIDLKTSSISILIIQTITFLVTKILIVSMTPLVSNILT